MKWLLSAIIAYSLIWIFFKNELPKSIQDSSFSDFSNSILYPIEHQLQKNFPEYFKSRHRVFLMEIKAEKLIKKIEKVKDSPNNGVLFFYNDNSIVTRHIIAGINRILEKKKSLRDHFFIVAVGKDKKRVLSMLNSFKYINFVPYFLDEKDDLAKLNTFLLLKNNRESIDKFPITFYKRKANSEFDDISSNFFTKGRIEQLLETGL